MKQLPILPSSRRWLLALLGLALGACAGTGARRPDPLPFRLAVVPTVVNKLEPVGEGEQKADMPFSVDTETFTEALAERLRGSTFAEVVVLSADGEDWNAKASVAHADLILACRLDYNPLAASKPNDRFYLNLPLFLLGGPFCWFVRDRSYRYEATLDVQVFDAHLPGDVRNAAMGSRAVPIATVTADDSLATLNFLNRASGPGPYVLSLFIPAGFISRKSDAAAETLSEKITKQLVEKVSQRLEDSHRQLLNVRATPFEVVRWRVARSGDGYDLEGEVDVLLASGAQELGECQILVGDMVLSVDVKNDAAVDGMVQGRRVRRTPIHAAFSVPDDLTSVRLSIRAGEMPPRTFTIDLNGVSARFAALSNEDGVEAVNQFEARHINTFEVRAIEASFEEER